MIGTDAANDRPVQMIEAEQQKDEDVDLVLGLWQQEPSAALLQRLKARHGGSLGAAAQAALAAALRGGALLRALPPRAAYLTRLLKALEKEADGDNGNGAAPLCDELAELMAEALLAPAATAAAAAGTAAGASRGFSHKTWLYAPAPLASGRELRALEAAHAARLRAALEREAEGEADQEQQPQHEPPPATSRTDASPADADAAATSAAAPGLITLGVSDDMLDGNTGCHEWEAGFLLAEFVLSHARLFAGAVVLPLHCCLRHVLRLGSYVDLHTLPLSWLIPACVPNNPPNPSMAPATQKRQALH